MQTIQTVPEQSKTFEVIDFHLRNGSKVVHVTVRKETKIHTIEVDMTEPISDATSTQRTIIKGFFKAVGRLATNQVLQTEGATPVTSGEITGDLFDES